MKETWKHQLLRGAALAIGCSVVLAADPVLGQANQILTVSPTNAAQGTANLLVTFTLDADAPPAPPAAILPTSVMLGTNVGTPLARTNQYIVPARFNISAGELVGAKDASVSFSTPNGTVTFSKAAAFQVIAGSGIVANFFAQPTSGTLPLTVNFTDLSTGTVTSRLWNFGDGTTSGVVNPSHTYTNTGRFTVSLVVSGSGGSDVLTRSDYIAVTAPMTNTGAYPIVDTAQTISFNNTLPITAPTTGQPFHGQDAQHAGNPPRYVDNGDGTVSDLVTGLMWQQDPGAKVTFVAATNGAAGFTLGGFTDWRLPTIKELYSLILFTGLDASPCMAPGAGACGAVPFLDTNYFRFEYGNTNSGERVIDAQNWSSTEYVSTTMGGDATVFGVNFADGRIKGYPRDTGPGGTPFTEFCRYVRGNPSYGRNHFTNHGDGTITDQATWLMWARDDSGTGLNWSNALAWVQAKNASNHLGYRDWRLPDAKELQSLVDYTRSPATTASAAIDPVFNSTAIVNEAGQVDWPAYWTSTTHEDASRSGAWGVYVCFGRALGYMNSTWLDVHGAGAQRSDPKTGSALDYPSGHGPQGDAVRVTNFVRLVRSTSLNADTVGDGIPDWWRRQYFGSATSTNATSCAACDSDHDGANNISEFGAGTNPTNAASVLRLLSRTTAGTELELSWDAMAGKQYQIEQTAGLGTSNAWSLISDVLTNGRFVPATTNVPAGFFRVRIAP